MEQECPTITGGIIRARIATPVVVTAIISKETVEELDIKARDKVEAVIKVTEVMVAK